MKRGILLVLIGLLLVASMAGCNAYRRSVVTAPENTVETRSSRGEGTRDFHYRRDGQVVDGTRRHVQHNYRHDGRVTDTDGLIGNGTHADGHHTTRRATERVGDGVNTTFPRTGGNRPMDGVGPGAYRSDLVAR